MGQPREGSEHAGAAAGNRRVRGAHLRRARGARHPLPRGAGALGAQPGAEAVADAVPLDDQPLPRLHPRLSSTASLAHPHVPRPQRRARTSSARSWSRSTCPELVRAELGAADVEGRARRARDQHRPVPVGRGPLPPDGGDLGGDARLRQPVLGADQVAAAVARPRADEARSPRGPSSSPTSRSRRWRRRPGGRPSRTRRIRASGSRRSPSSTAPGSRPGVLIAPLIPGVNDAPGPGRGAGRGGRGGGRRERRRRRPAPARRGARDLVRLAAPVPARPGAALRGALPPRRLHGRRTSARRSRRRARGRRRPRRFTAAGGADDAAGEASASTVARKPRGSQARLF